MIRKWWDYIVAHNVWNKVLAGLIVAGIIQLIAYSKDISFIQLLKSALSYQFSFGWYLIITIVLLIIYQIIRRIRKRNNPNLKALINIEPIETSSKANVISKQIAVENNLIFDSNIVDEKAFSGYGQKIYDTPTRQLVGVIGSGTFDFKIKILTINRTNREGRFIIPLTKYFFHKEAVLFVPKYLHGKSPRNFRVKFSGRAISGVHRIVFVFRKKEGFDWINSTTIIINQRGWANQIASYAINSDEDFVIELHTYVDSNIPATLQIQDLIIEEI